MNKLYKDIENTIKKSEKILLSLHPSPDGDSLGSNLAMYLYLTSIGKKVTFISGDSPPPSYLDILPAFDKIILKNITELNLASFDLFIGIDSAGLEQVSRKDGFVIPASLKTINIDHHDSNTAWANINLIEATDSAAGQTIYDLLTYLKADITSDIAINLFVAIFTDSGGFRYSKTSPHTFEIATNLTKIYPDFYKVIFEIDNNETPGRMFYKAIALKNIDLYFDDNLAISSVSQLELSQKNINVADTEKSNISNLLKTVKGWNIGACLVETEANVCNLSLRTRDPDRFNVSLLAQALGGGGHPAAAGTQIKKPLDQAKEELIKTVGDLFFSQK